MGIAVSLSACASHMPHDQQRLMNIADDVEQRGDHATAAALYTQSATQFGYNPEIYRRIGEAWLAAGEPENARQIFLQQLSSDPDNPSALLGLGTAQLQLGLPESAVRSLSAAAPRIDTADVWSRLGTAQAMTGQLDDAEKSLLTGLEKRPNDLNMKNNLGLIYSLSGQHDKAKSTLLDALDSPLSEGRHHRNILLALVLAGDIDSALQLPVPDLSSDERAALIQRAQRIAAIEPVPDRARALGFQYHRPQ